jgi:hypothetical protein
MQLSPVAQRLYHAYYSVNTVTICKTYDDAKHQCSCGANSEDTLRGHVPLSLFTFTFTFTFTQSMSWVRQKTA